MRVDLKSNVRKTCNVQNLPAREWWRAHLTTLATVSSVHQAAQGGVAANAFRNLNCIIITKILVVQPEMQDEPVRANASNDQKKTSRLALEMIVLGRTRSLLLHDELKSHIKRKANQIKSSLKKFQ